MSTKQHFGIDPKAELAEFEAIAERHPVFRIDGSRRRQEEAGLTPSGHLSG